MDNTSLLTVRPLQQADIPKIVDYFWDAPLESLERMGADKSKFPIRSAWIDRLEADCALDTTNRQFYYIIWLSNGVPIGHSNINKITFGAEAYMHLHLWQPTIRQQGMGEILLNLTLPYYFETYQLKRLFCEPAASNPAPNKILPKVGFTFIQSYDTTPGWINTFQTVNRWCLTAEQFLVFRTK